jgi:hypothetical protein
VVIAGAPVGDSRRHVPDAERAGQLPSGDGDGRRDRELRARDPATRHTHPRQSDGPPQTFRQPLPQHAHFVQSSYPCFQSEWRRFAAGSLPRTQHESAQNVRLVRRRFCIQYLFFSSDSSDTTADPVESGADVAAVLARSKLRSQSQSTRLLKSSPLTNDVAKT